MTSIFGNGAAGTDVAGGTDIMDQVARYIASLGGYRTGIYGLTGTVDPRAYGESYDPSTGIPTLAARDSARSDAEFNAQQRQYDANLKLQTQGLLAGMSGPKDQIAYQYLLAGLSAPTPSGQAQPFQTTNVPYTAPTAAPVTPKPAAVTVAPTPPTAPGAALAASYAAAPQAMAGGAGTITSGIRDAYGAANPDAAAGLAGFAQVEAAQKAAIAARDTVPGMAQGGILDGPEADVDYFGPFGKIIKSFGEVLLNGGLTPEQQKAVAERRRDMLADVARAAKVEGQYPSRGIPRRAGGGTVQGGRAIVGDDPKAVHGTEEMLTMLPPKGGKSRVKVEPLSPDKDPIEVMLKMPARAIRMALGGIFGGDAGPSLNTYDAAAIGGQPGVQAVKNGGRTPSFTGFGTELSNPDLGLLDLPSAPNAAVLNRLRPSQQDAVASAYNQGLRVDYRDIVANAIAATPRGKSGSSLAAYGL